MVSFSVATITRPHHTNGSAYTWPSSCGDTQAWFSGLNDAPDGSTPVRARSAWYVPHRALLVRGAAGPVEVTVERDGPPTPHPARAVARTGTQPMETRRRMLVAMVGEAMALAGPLPGDQPERAMDTATPPCHPGPMQRGPRGRIGPVIDLTAEAEVREAMVRYRRAVEEYCAAV